MTAASSAAQTLPFFVAGHPAMNIVENHDSVTPRSRSTSNLGRSSSSAAKVALTRVTGLFEPKLFVTEEAAPLEAQDRKEIIHEAIAQLPENYRNVILLRDIQELSTDETAAALDLTPGAVKVRLHRARAALRTLLKPRLEDL